MFSFDAAQDTDLSMVQNERLTIVNKVEARVILLSSCPLCVVKGAVFADATCAGSLVARAQCPGPRGVCPQQLCPQGRD